MRCLFVITEQMDPQQLDQCYLLCIAMLNFDHQVDVVFEGRAFAEICTSAEAQKKWLALKLYGVDHLYQLQPHVGDPTTATQTPIDMADFATLKTQMDWIS